MKKDICGLLIVLLLVIASRAGAHPGDGLVVVDDRTFYFVATDPLQGSSPTHHAALWRWSEEGGLALAYRSRHGSSNLHIEQGWMALFIAPSGTTWASDRLRPATTPVIGMSLKRNWADWDQTAKSPG